MSTRYWIILGTAWLAAACGGESNVADCEQGKKQVPCSERTPDEEARLALDEKDYTKAIELLTALVTEYPEEYQRYPLLASAHAARSGFDLLAVARNQFTSGGTLFDQLAQFVPDPAETGEEAYDASLADMDAAVAWLRRIPADRISATSAESYAGSASLQLTLYGAAYSVMYLNQFTISADTGQFDPALLENMTEEDALVVISSLAAAGAQQTGEDGEALNQRINEAVANIDSQPGATNADRLRAFIDQEQSGETQ
jgi:hypothetical protein